MKLPRPYIPLDVRFQVIVRQLRKDTINGFMDSLFMDRQSWPLKKKIAFCLALTFGNNKVHLDHDPPLMLRLVRKSKGKIIAYLPDANDPEHLIYRTVEDHRTKTFVRGDGAQRSDTSQRRYLKRVAKNRKPKKKKRTIPGRRFNGEAIPSRWK